METKECPVCGFILTEEHHIIPYSWGGKDVGANKAHLCPNHHKLAHLFLKYGITKEKAELNEKFLDWLKRELVFLDYHAETIEPVLNAFFSDVLEEKKVARFGRTCEILS